MNDIRIGTLVKGDGNVAGYIKSILPHGFESFSITFWQTTKGVDFAKLADEVAAVLDGSGAVVSSLAIFCNPLEDGELDQETLRGWEACIDNAHLFGCDIVAGFTGRLRGKPIHESIPRFQEVWSPLAERAAGKNVRIAFENCDMGGRGKVGIGISPTTPPLGI